MSFIPSHPCRLSTRSRVARSGGCNPADHACTPYRFEPYGRLGRILPTGSIRGLDDLVADDFCRTFLLPGQEFPKELRSCELDRSRGDRDGLHALAADACLGFGPRQRYRGDPWHLVPLLSGRECRRAERGACRDNLVRLARIIRPIAAGTRYPKAGMKIGRL